MGELRDLPFARSAEPSARMDLALLAKLLYELSEAKRAARLSRIATNKDTSNIYQ